MANNKLIEYLPTFIRSYREMMLITDSQQEEFNILLTEKDQILNNAFVLDADEYGVERYESILGILAIPSQSLDDRKFNIQVKLNEQLPYTVRMLIEKLTNLCGEGNFEVSTVSSEYKLDVKIALSIESNFDSVKSLVENVVPCNLITSVIIMYEQYQTLKQYTNEEMAMFTHEQIKNKAVNA